MDGDQDDLLASMTPALVVVGAPTAPQIQLSICSAASLALLPGKVGTAASAEYQQVMEVIRPEAGDQSWTGGTQWACGQVLADVLQRIDCNWAASRVCELGAGNGLVGLTAAALGAQNVILTDIVLFLARHNADSNFSGRSRQNISVEELPWGDKSRAAAVGKVDIILGSDLIYQSSQHNALANTCAALSHSGTVIYLCNCHRLPPTGGFHPFFSKLRGLGFQVEDVTAALGIAAAEFVDFRGPLSIVRCTMPAGSSSPAQQGWFHCCMVALQSMIPRVKRSCLLVLAFVALCVCVVIMAMAS